VAYKQECSNGSVGCQQERVDQNRLAWPGSGKVEQLSPETGPLAGCDVITESLGFGKGCREEIL